MTAMLSLVSDSAEPFFAIPIPPGLDPVARNWIAAHVHQGVMVLLPGEALFAEPQRADDFATHLGAAWAVSDEE
ncbi:MAG: hypothetical protein H7Z12_05165 [Rhodospirillaceae bacterium]|nr:hypothetical protein [Rhodospirillales bacterium]